MNEKMRILNVVRKEEKKTIQFLLKTVAKENDRILNVGSSSTRFGKSCINLDIREWAGIDLVGDAH